MQDLEDAWQCFEITTQRICLRYNYGKNIIVFTAGA
jgi:hypothetical protein